MASTISTFCSPAHCVKSVRILSFSTPIPVFSPNAGEKTDQKHSQYENFYAVVIIIYFLPTLNSAALGLLTEEEIKIWIRKKQEIKFTQTVSCADNSLMC